MAEAWERAEQDKQATAPAPAGVRSGFSRRTFLRGALLGSALMGSGCVMPPPAPLTPEAATPTPEPGFGLQPASPLVPPLDPSQMVENWVEPWTWRVGDWPAQQLHLNVTENENPGPVVGFGNPNPVLFSYGGVTPGPTIRMRGHETLRIKLRNLLGEDVGRTPVRHSPDPNELTPELDQEIAARGGAPRHTYEVIPADVREDWCLGEHANGQHSAHVTNLHTHGLHVRPGTNPDGTHSDNVLLRVLSQADYRRRESSPYVECRFLQLHEQVGEADYEFRLGGVLGDPRAPHPPGTHWYHPHAHGATHNQVASGMAGALIVEGDVDEAINSALTGIPHPNLEQKSGTFDYRERLMFIQRVLVPSRDPDAPSQQLKSPPTPTVNGSSQPKQITMRPGAVERWRVLNGSVDGRGFKRFMVLEGHYVYAPVQPQKPYNPSGPECRPYTQQFPPRRLQRVEADGTLTVVSEAQIEAAKQQLYQLAMDGVTLVTHQFDQLRYTIKDLALQNAGSTSPLADDTPLDPNPNRDRLLKLQNVYRDGDNIRNGYVRPNEVYLGPANRADLFFKAPPGGRGKVYTVLAKAVVVHADNYQQQLQQAAAAESCELEWLIEGPEDIIVATIGVDGRPVDDPLFPIMDLRLVLPDVPPYLRPIGDELLAIGPAEARTRGLPLNSFRTRTVTYSGWGAQDYPLVTVPDDFTAAQPQLEKLVYAPHNGVNVLLPPNLRTMAIDGRKFDPDDPQRPRILANSAEEWALYNSSITLWGETDPAAQPPGQYKAHYVGLPLQRAEGQARFAANSSFQIVTKAVDHPFHMHTNPFWVMRIEVPDENGELHNILDEPRWQDTVWIPRNGGRVIFRSRFVDYTGTFVNHCHLLLHEDNGMMQPVEVTEFAEQTNYVAKEFVLPMEAPGSTSTAEVDGIYPRPSLADSYRQSIGFVDPNPATGQVYPGFAVAPPQV